MNNNIYLKYAVEGTCETLVDAFSVFIVGTPELLRLQRHHTTYLAHGEVRLHHHGFHQTGLSQSPFERVGFVSICGGDIEGETCRLSLKEAW